MSTAEPHLWPLLGTPHLLPGGATSHATHRGSVLLLSLPNSYLSTYFQFFEFAAPIFSPATGEPPLLHILSLILSGPHLFDLWFCILLAILLKYVVHRSFNWHYRDD